MENETPESKPTNVTKSTESTESTEAESTKNNSVEATAKPSEPRRAWADEADDDDELAASSPSPASSSLGLDLDELAIDDSKKKKADSLDEPEDSNIKAVTSGHTLYSTAMTFEDLNLSTELLKGLYVGMNFKRPSKIQSISLPMILTPPHKDLVAQAHNGSGKTTCFVLGMLSRVDVKLREPQALCICPTRELAIQNLEVLMKMGQFTGITSVLAVPEKPGVGVPTHKMPPVTAQIVIGTPGTIGKWLGHGKLGMRALKILVFDEADHMLAEGGFRDDSLKVIKAIEKVNKHCQVLLFSATFNDVVKSFVSRVVRDGNQLFVKKEELSLDVVKQYKVHCPDELAKISVIRDKIFEYGDKVGQTIVFVRTRTSAAALHESLAKDGYVCTSIHGTIDHENRDKVVKEFREGLTKVLISTDILARGFDQSQVNLVVNYDLPFIHDHRAEPDYEVYLHRCGRAGRFGRKGAVFNFLRTDNDYVLMDKIQRHFGHQVHEIHDWRSDQQFEDALKAAGLL
ncbi:hypothetical protein Syun_022736 [Stephania yunnanensis]|uniref:RNA helicase n=1 Tax=Stephania yunnanensis TaxID=152371 RepID=A0AAP0I312_9MAGN